MPTRDGGGVRIDGQSVRDGIVIGDDFTVVQWVELIKTTSPAGRASSCRTTLSLSTADIDFLTGGVSLTGTVTNAVHTQDKTLTLMDHDTGQVGR